MKHKGFLSSEWGSCPNSTCYFSLFSRRANRIKWGLKFQLQWRLKFQLQWQTWLKNGTGTKKGSQDTGLRPSWLAHPGTHGDTDPERWQRPASAFHRRVLSKRLPQGHRAVKRPRETERIRWSVLASEVLPGNKDQLNQPPRGSQTCKIAAYRNWEVTGRKKNAKYYSPPSLLREKKSGSSPDPSCGNVRSGEWVFPAIIQLFVLLNTLPLPTRPQPWKPENTLEKHFFPAPLLAAKLSVFIAAHSSIRRFNTR